MRPAPLRFSSSHIHQNTAPFPPMQASGVKVIELQCGPDSHPQHTGVASSTHHHVTSRFPFINIVLTLIIPHYGATRVIVLLIKHRRRWTRATRQVMRPGARWVRHASQNLWVRRASNVSSSLASQLCAFTVQRDAALV